ncbi:MAG TPA: penicillin acylase family protein, partial [Candidatus Acidoferrales bacterium]|nr:penicillin acylase family protein [Candidatus Acidoferrales bacterium]
MAVPLLILTGCFLDRGLPPREVHVPGVSAPVSVKRDAAGIPHIHAENRSDLYRALGYVQAQDRLFQLQFFVRLAEGRLAEVVGPDALESDRVFRTFDPEAIGRATLAMYPPAVRTEIEAFADGVNAWVDEVGDHPPATFSLLGTKPRHLSAVDLLSAVAPLAVLLGANLSDEVFYLNVARRLSPDVIAELLPVSPVSPLEPPPLATTDFLHSMEHTRLTIPKGLRTGLAASNNWVVDGTKSVSGKPMLANDPHLPQSLPSIWYEAVLSTPDMFMAGAMVVGSPTIAIGTNGHVSWGVTNVQADTMDLCLEELSADGKSYRFRDQWLPIQEREVKIDVKGKDAESYKVRSTQHGPLLDDLLTAPKPLLTTLPANRRFGVALRFAAPPGGTVWTSSEAATAKNGTELVDAYRHFFGIVLNLVWADDSGNIGWHVVGGIPDRNGFSGKYPMPCADGRFEWRGMIPFDQLPHVENPPEHFIVTANQRITDVPYNGTWSPPWRSQRISQLLSSKSRLSLDDFKMIQGDRVSLYAQKVRDLAVQAGDGGDADLAWALLELRTWDGTMSAASRAAALCAALEVEIPARVLRSTLGDTDYAGLLSVADFGVYNASEDIVVRPESKLWPANPTARTQLIRDAMRDAIALLQKKLGSNRDSWTWGRLHQVRFKHPISQGDDFVAHALGWYFNRGPFIDAGG